MLRNNFRNNSFSSITVRSFIPFFQFLLLQYYYFQNNIRELSLSKERILIQDSFTICIKSLKFISQFISLSNQTSNRLNNLLTHSHILMIIHSKLSIIISIKIFRIITIDIYINDSASQSKFLIRHHDLFQMLNGLCIERFFFLLFSQSNQNTIFNIFSNIRNTFINGFISIDIQGNIIFINRNLYRFNQRRSQLSCSNIRKDHGIFHILIHTDISNVQIDSIFPVIEFIKCQRLL